MRRVAVALFGLVVSTFASAQWSACPANFPGRSPVPIAVNVGLLRELCFEGFAVLHSGEARTPLVAVQRLTREGLKQASSQSRTDKFYEEARLPARERGRLAAYARSGWDRGHLAAAAEMETAEAMAQSFSLANVVPMNPALNRGAWLEVERSTRRFVRRASGPVYVYTGAYYAPGRPETIGWPWESVRVPTAIYKLVYDAAGQRAWAYWLENTAAAQIGRPITYAALVERTGIAFLPQGALASN